MSTPSIPGVDREDLADAIRRATITDNWLAAYHAADAALAHIAAHQECACDREHADEWVEVDRKTWYDLPTGTRVRWEGCHEGAGSRHFVHRDDLPADLPDDPRALIARELGPARADTFLGLLDEHGWTVTRKGER